jgi:hypothetical protein
MDKYQLVLIEIEVSLSKIIAAGICRVDELTRPRKANKKKKEVEGEEQIEVEDSALLHVEDEKGFVPRTPVTANFVNDLDKYASLDDLDSLHSKLINCAAFVRRHIDDLNAAISIVSREIYPLIVQLKNLLHIARAHPESALKRAKEILKPKKTRPVTGGW